MKIRRDLLQIASGVRHADGTKAEPEQQPVQRVIETTAATTAGGSNVGQMPVRFVSEMSAGELAQTASRTCSTCKHFDHALFQKVLRNADHPAAPLEKRQAVSEIRAALLMSGNANLNDMHSGLDGDFDVEAAMKSCGVCRALTQRDDDLNVFHPLASCPAHVISPTSPHGFYVAKDNAAKKEASQNYDAVLRQAQGKLIP